MPRSPFFMRIKRDVLQIVDAIPQGKICSFASIGEHLDVVPRHVAYILATLTPAEKQRHPWHRVVGADGRLGTPKRSNAGETQAELLEIEGVSISRDAVLDFPGRRFRSAAQLKSGVAKQTRPANAPVRKARSASLTRKRRTLR